LTPTLLAAALTAALLTAALLTATLLTATLIFFTIVCHVFPPRFEVLNAQRGFQFRKPTSI
jgi:hypothetical protein